MPNSKSSERKGRKSADDGAPESGRWLTTYTDVCTLLLTFFVLLLSMSVIDETRKQAALESVEEAFGFLPYGRSPIGKEEGVDVSKPGAPMIPDAPFDFEMLQEITLKNELDPDVKLMKKEEKLVIVIDEKVLFRSGTFELQPRMEDYLETLARYLKNDPRELEIRGHTDPFEMLSHPPWTDYSWELSTRRAMTVSRYLMSQGIAADRLSAHGFSYHRPLVDGQRFPHLRHKNHRVEIIVGVIDTLPASLIRSRAQGSPFFNYKNFIFRMFPMPAADRPTDKAARAAPENQGMHTTEPPL
jgi:chemotaxis protein MotB